VAPFDIRIPKTLRWYLVYREARLEEAAFAAFREWIKKAAGAPEQMRRRPLKAIR
jgi:LysR family transcriptional regulator, glycine cleavage system transcriptional activator